MKKDQLYILLFGTTLTSVALVIINYFNEKKKKRKKEEEEKKTAYLKCKTLFDFENLASKLMKKHRFYYYNYKAGQGITYNATREYFDHKLRILPRVLIDVTQISLETTIFGSKYSCPILIAPSTFHCLANVDGEVGTARGARDAECIYTYNWKYSTMPEENVLQINGPKFLHVYLTTPVEILERIIVDAEKKGYRSIVVTCDHPTDRVRDNVLPLFEEASKTIDLELEKSMPMPNMNISDIIVKQNFATGSVTWNNIQSIRSLTKLPIICKGILSTIDAQLAVKYGANGIIVSNHGGRQVDTAPPAIECLEDIVQTVGDQIEVFVDTGIRTGGDILKSLALGAKAVFIGRPILYGLACGGHDGVKKVLEILKQELRYDMASCGITSIHQINKDVLYKHSSNTLS